MAGESPDEIRVHIAAISSHTQRDRQRLADALHGRAWPGGGNDRSEPGAFGWLRRWRPSGPSPLPPLCGCASGRCVLCN
jgi:hypothetical protein